MYVSGGFAKGLVSSTVVYIKLLLVIHTTKRCLKRSGLIIKNLVGRGNRTPDC